MFGENDSFVGTSMKTTELYIHKDKNTSYYSIFKEKDSNGDHFSIPAHSVAVYYAKAILCDLGNLRLSNFSDLYSQMENSKVKREKFKCIWHYLTRMVIR